MKKREHLDSEDHNVTPSVQFTPTKPLLFSSSSKKSDEAVKTIAASLAITQLCTPDKLIIGSSKTKLSPYLRGFLKTHDDLLGDNLFHLSTSFPTIWEQKCSELKILIATIDLNKITSKRDRLKVNIDDFSQSLYDQLYSHSGIYALVVDNGGANFDKTVVPAYHIAQTVIYEYIKDAEIGGKSHSKKSADILNSLFKKIEKLDILTSATAKGSKVYNLLQEFKAYLCWHVKLCSIVLPENTDKKHEKLAKVKGLVINLDEGVLYKMHPVKPVEETPGKEITTPIKNLRAVHTDRILSLKTSNNFSGKKLFFSPTKKKKPTP